MRITGLESKPLNPYYQEYFSPNKKYEVILSQAPNQQATIVIKNTSTGKEEASFDMIYTPILRCEWAPDSKAMIIVVHSAGSSSGKLIVHNQTGWKKYDGEPPLKVPCTFRLFDVSFLKQQARLSYGIIQLKLRIIRQYHNS